MSTLRDRTQPSFYAGLKARLHEAGLPDAEINSEIARHVREAHALLAGKCPKCGKPSARYVDRQQQGASSIAGVWVQYRCSSAPPPGRPRGNACDFMVDFKEDLEAN